MPVAEHPGEVVDGARLDFAETREHLAHHCLGIGFAHGPVVDLHENCLRLRQRRPAGVDIKIGLPAETGARLVEGDGAGVEDHHALARLRVGRRRGGHAHGHVGGARADGHAHEEAIAPRARPGQRQDVLGAGTAEIADELAVAGEAAGCEDDAAAGAQGAGFAADLGNDARHSCPLDYEAPGPGGRKYGDATLPCRLLEAGDDLGAAAHLLAAEFMRPRLAHVGELEGPHKVDAEFGEPRPGSRCLLDIEPGQAFVGVVVVGFDEIAQQFLARPGLQGCLAQRDIGAGEPGAAACLGFRLEDDDGGAGIGGLERRHEAGGARAHDDDVRLVRRQTIA